jgi:hypothetical protein
MSGIFSPRLRICQKLGICAAILLLTGNLAAQSATPSPPGNSESPGQFSNLCIGDLIARPASDPYPSDAAMSCPSRDPTPDIAGSFQLGEFD